MLVGLFVNIVVIVTQGSLRCCDCQKKGSCIINFQKEIDGYKVSGKEKREKRIRREGGREAREREKKRKQIHL